MGVSIDGYIAGDDHSLEWLKIVETDPPEDTGCAAFWAELDALDIGRHLRCRAGFRAVPVQRQVRDRADHAPC